MVLFSTVVVAEVSRDSQAIESARALVAKMSHDSLYIRSTFQGPDGLIGLHLASSDTNIDLEKTVVAWATPSGEYLIAGPILDVNLVDITLSSREKIDSINRLNADTHLAPLDGVSLMRLNDEKADLIVRMQGVYAGDNLRHLLTVIFDPRCPYCRSLYNTINSPPGKKLLDESSVALKWVPVNVFSEKADLSAFILDNGNQGLYLVETQQVTNANKLIVSEQSVQHVADNDLLFAEAMKPSVPATTWVNSQGENVYIIGNFNLDMLRSIVKDISGK
jgi:hypothetical protein